MLLIEVMKNNLSKNSKYEKHEKNEKYEKHDNCISNSERKENNSKELDIYSKSLMEDDMI